ncbi:MAG: protease inhibitor I42 family protein [Sterolibacteriaceae bacterium]|nr:protease inhibitor I42 family protein [Candidatus Methylophosphatis haderslevensis]
MLPVWRSRLIRLLPALLAAALLASGCASPRAPVIATDLDADRVIGLRVGQSLVITLPADRDSGRQWQLEQPTLQALALDGQPTYMRETVGGSADSQTAQSGSETWRFVAVRSGRDELHFAYRHPDDGQAPPARVIGYSVSAR